MNVNNKCPKCDKAMKAWDALSDEEREVVKRLPASAEYSLEERKALHRWCTRCWHESLAADVRG